MRFRRRPRWLERPPPAPDAYSYSIVLTALRQLGDAPTGTPRRLDAVNEAVRDEASRDASGGTIPTGGAASSGAAASAAAGVARGVGRGGILEKRRSSAADLARAQTAARILQSAEARGVLRADEPLSAPVAHSLVSSCGDDVRAATALFRDVVRPRLLRARSDGPRFAPAGAQPTAEQAALHALLRVCGAADRADEALKVVYAMRRDGCPVDSTCYSAFVAGKRPEASATEARRLLQRGYERLLALELAPERVDGPRFGSIEKIRIQFAPPGEAER
jgi:pentatricopeptide repeat protein